MKCRKTHKSFSLRDVRHYPCFLIYSLMVLGLDSPIEHTKYPSDHNVFSFFTRIIFFHATNIHNFWLFTK